MIRFIFLGVVLATAAFAAAPEQPPQMTATQPFELDAATGEIVARGNVQLLDGEIFLTADEVRFNKNTNIATAKGHVTFTFGTRRALADTLTYHRDDGTFSAENVRVGDFPIYADGVRATGTKDEMTVFGAHITYREPGPFQPTLTAEKLTYAPGHHLRAESAVAGVGRLQAIPFPKFQQSLHEPIISNLSMSAGYRGSLGAFVDLGLRVPVASNAWLGGDVSFFTKRGVMFGPAGRYESANLNGFFRSGFINDHGEKLSDVLGHPVAENRGYFEWEHRQQITENLTLAGQVNYWKDSAIVRDFRPEAFFNVQEPDTFVESVYTGHNYFVSAFVRYQPNSFEIVQQRLPEVRFDLLPTAIGAGIYEQFNASAVRLREHPPLGALAQRSDRVDAYYALTRPFTPCEWLGITPVAGGRVTYYANTQGRSSAGTPILPGGATRVLGEVGFDAALRASATFDYKNPFWKIDGLRHLITPRLSYRYIPDADRYRDYIPAIDRREPLSGYLPPLGLDNVRNLDDLHPVSTVRIGLDNTVQTRDADYGSRDLLVFNLATDFRFHREPDEKDFSEVHTEFAFMPARWLQVDVYESFAPQNFTLREFNSGITIHDGTAWSVRFANNYLADQIEDYLVEGRMRISEILEARARLRYNARVGRMDEQSYGIVQNLANTWQLSYVVTLYSGRQRESDFGFSVRIETLRF